MERESRDLNITVRGDFAFCYGYLRVGGTPKAVGRPISFWIRPTKCFQRSRLADHSRTHVGTFVYVDESLRPSV